VRKADNLQLSCAVGNKYGSLNFLETFGPVQACNGTAFALPTYKGKYVSNWVLLISGMFSKNDYSHSQIPATARTPSYLAFTPLDRE